MGEPPSCAGIRREKPKNRSGSPAARTAVTSACAARARPTTSGDCRTPTTVHWQAASSGFRAGGRSQPVRQRLLDLNLAHARMRCGQYDRGAEAAQRGRRAGARIGAPRWPSLHECLNAANRKPKRSRSWPARSGRPSATIMYHLQLATLHHLDRSQERPIATCGAVAAKTGLHGGPRAARNVFTGWICTTGPANAKDRDRGSAATGPADLGDDLRRPAASAGDHLGEDLPELMRLMDDRAGYPQPFQLLAQPSTPPPATWRPRAGFAPEPVRKPAAVPQRAPRPASTRIRLGYLSSDLQEHATAYLLSQILEHHDRARFEVFAYSYGVNDASPARRRIERAVDRFVDVREISDRADGRADSVRRQRRADGPEGLHAGARNGVLAFRPSPIQSITSGTRARSARPSTTTSSAIRSSRRSSTRPITRKRSPRCRSAINRTIAAAAVGPRPTRSECGLPRTDSSSAASTARTRSRPKSRHLVPAAARHRAQRPVAVRIQRASPPQSHARSRAPGHRRRAPYLGRAVAADAALGAAAAGRPGARYAPVCATRPPVTPCADVPVLTCPGDTFVSRVAAACCRRPSCPS